jgi:hypothetical protein
VSIESRSIKSSGSGLKFTSPVLFAFLLVTIDFSQYSFIPSKSSSRRASLLQQDSTRMFPILLRMYRNAVASLSTHPADVPFAITGDGLMWNFATFF